ncbi:hypothetical protein LJB96_04100 [Methanobrevibacter sp. OttesenSCG-928-K11]|nr:hypothetical protein [Methanobrevibacter sp. OttesenSCG-928-K11]
MSEDEFSEDEKIQRAILYFLHVRTCYGTGHWPIEALKHDIYVDGKNIHPKKLKKQLKILKEENCIAPYGKNDVYIDNVEIAHAKIQDMIDNRKKI